MLSSKIIEKASISIRQAYSSNAYRIMFDGPDLHVTQEMLGWQEDSNTELSQTCAPSTYRILTFDIDPNNYLIIKKVAQTLSFPPPGVRPCGYGDYPLLTDSGFQYRVNIEPPRNDEEQRVPKIETEKVILKDGVSVTYRAAINKIGESRNIIHVEASGMDIRTLELNLKNVPQDIDVFKPYPKDKYYSRQAWYGPTTADHVLLIELYYKGQYSFDIGIELEDQEIGTITCHVEG